MKQIAILGATASGKTALAIDIAHEVGAHILSLDSLSVYKEVDIVSAKPTLEERRGITHFGIDALSIDEYFSVTIFFELYKKAKEMCEVEGKHLIIVGGTSFYLKSMLEGLSPKPQVSEATQNEIKSLLLDLPKAYESLTRLDPHYAQKIASSDRYRIEKWYEIYLQSGQIATDYFKNHQKTPLINAIPIFDIMIDREVLRQKIADRTTLMIENGLIDEVFALEKKYTRAPQPMGAIGIKETLAYLDGYLSKSRLHEQIATHTAQLAKRQETFNQSQFPGKTKLLKEDLNIIISQYFN